MRTIIRSRHIFDGTGTQPFLGYLEIRGPFITRVEHGWDYNIGEHDRLVKYDDQFVMPGLHDNHVFFSGWMAAHAGLDLSQTSTPQEALDLIGAWLQNHPGESVYAHGWSHAAWGDAPGRDLLDHATGIPSHVPVVAIDADRTRYWMNTAAVERYGFVEDQLSAESRVRLIHEMTHNASLVRTMWRRFEELLLSRGVVSIKDIVFDNCDVHEAISERLLDTSMVIEAVRGPFDKPLIGRYLKRSFGPRVRFGGVKIMVDGVVADKTGDINGRYVGSSVTPTIDYDAIESDVAYLSERGVSCCLTAEGDRAIERCAALLARHASPKVHHSISDMEMVSDCAARIMGDAGITAEPYPQILGLNPSYDEAYMPNVIEGESGASFFQYTNLVRHRVNVTCGTDCPLFVTSLPESILRASNRAFDDSGRRWFPEYAMPKTVLLEAWTHTGGPVEQDQRRQLKRGNPATYVVFDRDLIAADDNELKQAHVVETVIDGRTAYSA